MGAIYDFEPQKLIIGIIYSDKSVFDEVLRLLKERFGETDGVCEEFSFSDDFSTYYDGELGGKGMRRIYSFENLVDPSLQAEIKEFTNSLEEKFSIDGNRKINLDPGLISHGCLVLPTTKATGFRIPLKRGIYSELTLFWARGDWHKFPWTYRDYQSEKIQAFLRGVRKKYLSQRKLTQKK
ncbi:MAG: DUF4416 family protein [Clostridia bacterium]|nr:DUF4416 family protein [Clostridia bacterium]